MEGWRRLKLMCGVSALFFATCLARPQDPTAVAATVKEIPQRPMTLTNGYHPSSFPFNNGEPFVVDPNSGSIDFNTKPPPSAAQRSDDYYDYDASKLEEVPFDYKGDPIDRKDVASPGLLPRPNDIAPTKNKQTDIYQFLNLPVKYSSSDRFPLISSSYANTKIQGSGGSSSSSPLSNHKMPSTPAQTPTAATTSTTAASSWYNTVKLTTTRPTTAKTSVPTTTTTTTPVPQQEEYEYDYDYPHAQEPTSHQDTTTTQAATTTTTTTTTAAATTSPTTAIHQTNPPLPPSSFFITPEPSTAAAIVPSSSTTTTPSAPVTLSVLNRTTSAVQVTSVRPEIDSKLDGTSFADYDDAIKPVEKPRPQEAYGQHYKPVKENYQFDDKPYPLITNSKVPMTFTAHVSSGISLNQQKEQSSNVKLSPAPVSEPVYSSRPLRPESALGMDNPEVTAVYENSRVTFNSGKPDPPASMMYSKPKPPNPNGTPDQFDTVYKVRPDTYNVQQFPSTVLNRPTNPLIQSRPYQPEPPVIKTTQQDIPRKPVNTELQMSQSRPTPYPVQTDNIYVKNKPQYTPPQSQPDTSKFKPPKHVINHFIKTQPNEDNKSYALQTSFSIGMDGERTDTRPGQGVGQVLMVEDGSSEAVINHTIPVKTKSTTSIPLIPPPRLIQKQQPYPRPQWENAPKPPTYQQPPKRDGTVPPPQRLNLPNILPQFRPNARVDTPPTVPQSHSATIERVQIPIDHLRPPPLPKPQFLKVDRNDDNINEEILSIPEKESRILQKPGPQPAKVTTLQMIQHGAPTKLRDDNKENPVHIIYAANSPTKSSEKIIDDSVMLDVNDRSDVPILKTKTTIIKPTKTDFPYQIVKPDENQNGSSLEYKAYSPTKLDTVKLNNDQELVPNLQDYVPILTRDSSSNTVVSQKPITGTLKTSEDDRIKTVDEGHKPLLQNFQIPFQPSLKLPENSNGWSVIRKSQIDNASERIDETGDVVGSTEKFDPDNFKPQLVGGFMPISPPSEDAKEKKTVEQSERAKRSMRD